MSEVQGNGSLYPGDSVEFSIVTNQVRFIEFMEENKYNLEELKAVQKSLKIETILIRINILMSLPIIFTDFICIPQ